MCPALNNSNSVLDLFVLCSEFQTMKKTQKKIKLSFPTIIPPKMWFFVESVPGSKDRPA